MPRKRSEVPTERFNVSLPQPVAERVRRLAELQRRSGPAVITSLVASGVLAEVDDDAAEEMRMQASPAYQRLLDEKDRLAAALAEASRQLAQQRRATPAELRNTPRWAWPLDCLLADVEWWERWLPKLNQLMGSDGAGLRRPPIHAGYLDLMELIFPPIREVTWRSLEYRAAAEAAKTTDHRLELASGPGRALSWEPVIRHVARALAGLEGAEEPNADPFLGMRVQAEISGPWIDSLGHLLGSSPAALRNLPIDVPG